MVNLKKTKKKAVSRGDVARAAGVSVTTVTHALNPPPGVRMNPETKKRVCEIAREMGYRPNFFGRSLVTGKSFALGLLQPEYEALFLEFYQRMAYGLASSMAKDDYNLLMAFKDKRKNYLKLIRQGRVDGMIVLQSKSTDDDFKEIASTGIPTVMLNQPYNCEELENCVNICSDHEKLVDDIMGKLIENDRKKILSINDYNYCIPNFRVFDAFQKKANDFIKDGVNLVNLLPVENDFQTQLKNIFESGQRFDAIYIDGEEYILGLVNMAKQYGMECGKDYDLHVSTVNPRVKPANFTVPLTLHVQQGEKMGTLAWESIKKLIGKKKVDKQIKIPYLKMS
jgi:DNA-binding LacI/PurR family transcriptional regulator